MHYQLLVGLWYIFFLWLIPVLLVYSLRQFSCHKYSRILTQLVSLSSWFSDIHIKTKQHSKWRRPHNGVKRCDKYWSNTHSFSPAEKTKGRQCRWTDAEKQKVSTINTIVCYSDMVLMMSCKKKKTTFDIRCCGNRCPRSIWRMVGLVELRKINIIKFSQIVASFFDLSVNGIANIYEM